MNKKDVIVIGAGPGGLTSAMILAHRGFKVTVFEKAETVGGRNAAIRLGDYTFETGPTFLMMNFILGEMFEEAGRNAEDYLQFTALDPLYRLRFDETDVYMSADRKRLQEELATKFSADAASLERFFGREQARFENLFPCLQKDYANLASFLDVKLLRAIPHISFGRTMIDNLRKYFSNERMQLSFTFQSKYIGMSPWRCPSLFMLIPYVEHTFGIYHVLGGLNQISLAMAKVVREEGGEIHTGTPVRRLILDGRTVKGVELEGGDKVYADDVIINADFAYAMTNLVEPGSVRKYSAANLARKSYSCSTFMLYLGVDKHYDLPHHNIVFAKDYRSNVDDIFDRSILSEDVSFYVQNASVTDPSLAPAGKSTLYILVPVPNNKSHVDWDTEGAPFRDRVLDQVMARMSMTDLREHIEVEKIITPANWERDYNIYRGAIFSFAHNWSQLLYFRPRNRYEELNHCYLVGGGTHPGTGLPIIYEGARISSNLLCKQYGISYRPPSTLSAKHPVET